MARPVGKNLIVEKLINKPKTGIILPESVKSLDDEGVEFIVRAVGSLCELGLKIDDVLIFRPERVNLVPVDKDSELYLVPESFVIGVK